MQLFLCGGDRRAKLAMPIGGKSPFQTLEEYSRATKQDRTASRSTTTAQTSNTLPSIVISASGGKGIARNRRPQRDHSRVPQRYSRNAAANRQQHALGQELAYESPSSCAEGRADGDLALPHGPARQREVGEIRAADQQHHAHGRQQHI